MRVYGKTYFEFAIITVFLLIVSIGAQLIFSKKKLCFGPTVVCTVHIVVLLIVFLMMLAFYTTKLWSYAKYVAIMIQIIMIVHIFKNSITHTEDKADGDIVKFILLILNH